MSYYLEDNPNPTTAQYGWPRTWVSGVVGVHTTESGVIPSGADPGAENTAAFIARRADYGSYHMIADWDTIVPMTRPTFAAWADTTNNVHALSVSGAMDAARWRDIATERASGIVRNMGIAAAMLVRDAINHGVLNQIPPARRITAQQAIDGSAAGFYGHGETNPGTRYDPGTNFDWNLFLATYAAAVGGTISYQSATTEDDMPWNEKFDTDVRGSLQNITDTLGKLPDLDRDLRARLDVLGGFERDVRADLEQKGAQIAALTAANGQLVELLATSKGLSVDEIKQALATAVADGIKVTVEAK